MWGLGTSSDRIENVDTFLTERSRKKRITNRNFVVFLVVGRFGKYYCTNVNDLLGFNAGNISNNFSTVKLIFLLIYVLYDYNKQS